MTMHDVAITVKQTLLELEWEVLSHSAYSPDSGSIGLPPSPVNAARTGTHTLLKYRRSAKIHR